MSIKNGEIGKVIRLNTDFDLSANTDLQIIFTKPDQTTLTVNKAGGVTAPAVSATGIDINGDAYTYEANKYLEYPTASGDIDQIGQWTMRGTYTDSTPKYYIGDTVTFTVLPA